MYPDNHLHHLSQAITHFATFIFHKMPLTHPKGKTAPLSTKPSVPPATVSVAMICKPRDTMGTSHTDTNKDLQEQLAAATSR
jgi:hypothetical protein